MDYLERSDSSLFYEILPQLAPYVAARMNAQFGTDYDVRKYFDWILGGSTARPGWGTILQRWGSYDAYGLIGSQTDGGGYAFAMNTFSAPLFAATAKYDPRFADTVGRWMLNIHNAARFFYPDQMPAGNQWYGAGYIDDPAHVDSVRGAPRDGERPHAERDRRPLRLRAAVGAEHRSHDRPRSLRWELGRVPRRLGQFHERPQRPADGPERTRLLRGIVVSDLSSTTTRRPTPSE